jgi:hypothetical protein
VVVDDDAVARRQRLEDHGVGAADLGRGAERVGVALQLPVAAPEDVAREDHAGIALAAHLLDVLVGVRRAADDDELHPARDVAGMRAHASTSTCGLFSGSRRPTNRTYSRGSRPEALQRRTCAGLGVRRLLDAVGHDADALAVALLEDLRDRVGVGQAVSAQPGALRSAKRR